MIASEVLKKINKHYFDDILKKLYFDENKVDLQIIRYSNLLNNYINEFGDGDINIFSVPGRSEICGNHTDHQGGKVLAASVDLDIVAVVGKNNDNQVIIKNEFNMKPVNISNLKINENEKGTSESLVRGMAAAFYNFNYNFGGFNACMDSNVLQGSGLSSSAAFEVMIGTIFSGLYNDFNIDMQEIAKMSQYSENNYFGKPCGLMDQCACAIGGLINIDFKHKSVVKKIPIDFNKFGYRLCIVDVHASHADLTEDYSKIPEEMKKVAKYFNKNILSEINEEEFMKNLVNLRNNVSDRAILRAIHYYNENKRVDEITNALNNYDIEKFKKIITESGNSSYKYLQNIYSNSDVSNQSVAIALSLSELFFNRHDGVCRVHGGGFAGTIQAFVNNKDVFAYKKFIESIFGEGSCHILNIRNYGGYKVL